MRNIRVLFIALFVLGVIISQPAFASRSEIVVSAAASLTDAFTDIGKLYEKAHPGVSVKFNFASSGALAAQIEQGAPVDVFASASVDFMDRLAKKTLIVASTRKNIASNRLVVVVPESSKLRIKSLTDLKSNEIRYIAIGAPESVPAGKYSKEALQKLGLWDTLKDKLVYGSDVRQVRTYVDRGEAEAGFVFRTDVPAKGLRQAYLVPASLHAPIVYCAAAINQSTNLIEAKAFARFLLSRDGRRMMAKYGFGMPVK
jgi:molybdate transport system substrate-binding protein